jgi:DNA-binding CsgD family transcriptional regulator
MERLTQGDLRRLLEGLRELYASTDLETLPARILSALPKVVPADMTSYNEVNSKRGRVTGDIAPLSGGDAQAVLRRFAVHMREHPVLQHVERTGDGAARRISDFLSQRQFRRLALYREFYRPLGIEHQIAISLADRPALVIGIAFNRGRPDFSERERLLLDLLRPHVAQAYQNAQAVTALRRRADLPGGDGGAPGLIGLDREGRPRSCTPQARRFLDAYFRPRRRRADERLPEDLQRWVDRERARLTDDSDAPPPRPPLVVEQGARRLIVRLLAEPLGDQHVLLLEERRTTVAPAGAGALGESLGLTPREAEVLHWVAQGKTNAEVATILALSPLTVRTHLEHVFEKLGVETRTAATLRALEVLGRPQT